MRREPLAPSSRAQNLRGRRVMNSQARMARVSRNAYSTVTPPRPVTVRSATFGMPLAHQNPAAPRKRLYIPLPDSGAEIRLPAIPVIRLGWRLLSFLITTLCLAGIIAAFSVPQLQIESIKVMGMKRIKPPDIEAVLDLEGLSIVQVDIADIERKLAAKFPELVNMKVTVSLPAEVTITAVERQPVLAWRTDKSTVWIDQEGFVIPERGEVEGLISIQSREAPPIITVKKETDPAQADKKEESASPLSPQQVEPNLVSAAMVLKSRLPQETQILYNHPNGLGWMDPRGWSVIFGMNMQDIESRMNIYQSLSDQLVGKGVKPSMISVEFIDAPYYRTER